MIGAERAHLRGGLEPRRSELDALPGHGRSIAGTAVGRTPREVAQTTIASLSTTSSVPVTYAASSLVPQADHGIVDTLVAMAEKLRVIVAKPGLDGHDRGAKVVARALRDAGFEVIYTGLFQTPEQIAEAAIQEDADAVGLSCHSGAHMTLFPKVVKELRARGADDVVVVAGGVIPADDIPKLKDAGIEAVFTPGANTGDIATWLRDRLSAKT